MNIVILHCHYERGGVTQVVENHVRSLRDRADVERTILVSGSRIGGLSQATQSSTQQLVLDDFDYDSQLLKHDSTTQRAERIYQQLRHRLTSEGISPVDTVLHWHNHSLGKNTAVPGAIARLAANGWRLLLQIHDFAEDNRPQNYCRLANAIQAKERAAIDRYLYPIASQIHYCTLTRADAAVLVELGIPTDQVSCLPNMVIAPADVSPADRDDLAFESVTRVRRSFGLPTDAGWCVYPVRGIRRKNVGELLLISQLSGSDRYFGLTLCPSTTIEKRSYERWRQLARELAPAVVFDSGQHPDVSYVDNLFAADFVISTSVAEGFGMAFLEPWLLGREVIARRLRHVTDDFEASGINFSKFYDAIPIPGNAEWISSCRQQIAFAAEEAWKYLPEPFRLSHSPDLDRGDSIDFAKLIPAEQIRVLRRMKDDPGFRREVTGRSQQLCYHLQSPADLRSIDRNGEVVRQRYSANSNGHQLMSIYREVLAAEVESDVASPSRAGIAMELINRTRSFYPCRTEERIDEGS